MIGDAKNQEVLEQSLAIARKIEAKPYLSSILLSLGITAVDLQDPEAALDYFEQAEQLATNPSDDLQARLARFKLSSTTTSLSLLPHWHLNYYNNLRNCPPVTPPSTQPSILLPP